MRARQRDYSRFGMGLPEKMRQSSDLLLSCWFGAEISAVALLLASLWPVTGGLEACPAVPSFCQRHCFPQPQIKNGKGAAGKSGSPPSLRTYVKNASVHR